MSYHADFHNAPPQQSTRAAFMTLDWVLQPSPTNESLRMSRIELVKDFFPFRLITYETCWNLISSLGGIAVKSFSDDTELQLKAEISLLPTCNPVVQNGGRGPQGGPKADLQGALKKTYILKWDQMSIQIDKLTLFGVFSNNDYYFSRMYCYSLLYCNTVLRYNKSM